MILEGIVTTRRLDGTINVAPMGPEIDERHSEWQRLVLRPFPTSRTFQNLRATGEGVFHVTDDVLLMAKATIQDVLPPMVASTTIETSRLQDCCRYYEFRVESFDDSNERGRIDAKVVHADRVRDFLGLNRAKHAVVEAAILASRIGLLQRDEILARMEELWPLIRKTGGTQEKEAFDLLNRYVHQSASEERIRRREG